MSYLKWIYKYQYLQEEFKDIKVEEEKNIKEFNDHFSLDEEQSKDSPPKIEELLPDKDSKNPGKGLYKELSKKLHPDRGGNADEFSVISIMYRNHDTIGLFLKAQEHDIEVEKFLNDDLILSFDKSCQLVEKEINNTKNTLSWCWCNASGELDKQNQLKYLKEEFNLIPKS